MYDQPVPSTPEAQLQAKLQELERRLLALETAPRATSTSQRGGSFDLLDEDGNLLMTFGNYRRGAFNDYGFRLLTTSGATTIESNINGLEAPQIPLNVYKANDYVIVTSATFTVTWHAVASLLVSDTVIWGGAIAADAGTTGEARLRYAGGSNLSSVIPLPAGEITYAAWNLLHQHPLGGGFDVTLEVRRTSGTGNIYVYSPYFVSQAGSAGTGSTPGGL